MVITIVIVAAVAFGLGVFTHASVVKAEIEVATKTRALFAEIKNEFALAEAEAQTLTGEAKAAVLGLIAKVKAKL